MKMSFLKILALGFSLSTLTTLSAFAGHHSHSHPPCVISSDGKQWVDTVITEVLAILNNQDQIFIAMAAIAQSGGDANPATNSYLAHLIAAKNGIGPGGTKQRAAIVLDIFHQLAPHHAELITSIGAHLSQIFQNALHFSIAVNNGGDQQAILNQWIAAGQALGQDFAQLSSHLDPVAITDLNVRMIQTQAQKILNLASLSSEQAVAAVALDRQAHDILTQLFSTVVNQLVKDVNRKCHHHLINH